MTNGNIVISSAVAVGIFISAVGGWFAQNRILEAKVESAGNEARVVNNEQDKQIAAVVEAIQTLKADNTEIKRDVKEILKIVK